MRTLFALLLLVFLVVVGLGFYLDWFNFSVNRDAQGNGRGVSFNVNREKIAQSAARAGEGIQKVGKKVEQEAHKVTGSAAPATHTVRGRLKTVDAADHLLTIKTPDNRQVTVRTAPETKIRRHEVQVNMDELMEGDRLEVQYRDENGSHVATAIVVEPSI
jgi:hypothetical protein